MEFGGASSLVLLLAVGLWVAYLVPSIVRRRNEESTERNAVRLQQALRALAETAEAPTVMRAETTPRGVAEQQRRLKRTERERARAEAKADKARRRAEADAPVAETASARVPDADTLNPAYLADERRRASSTRRGRLVTTMVLATGLAAAGFGAWLGLTGGSWWVCIAGMVAVLAAIGMLQQLARVAASQRRAAVRRAAERDEAPLRTSTRPRQEGAPLSWIADQVAEIGSVAAPAAPAAVAATADTEGWTPVPLPKPLYLRNEAETEGPDGGPGGPDGPGGGHRPPSVDIEALRAAARASEQAIRDAHRQPGVATFGSIAVASAAATAPSMHDTQPLEREALLEAVYLDPIEAPNGRLGSRPSRWERMGVVDERELGAEVEGALRRRRAS